MVWWRCTHFQGRRSKGTALMRELLWPCTIVCPLEQAAFVAKLYQHEGELQKVTLYTLTTLPGLRLDRLQVDVSVVQQLKHRLRILSFSLVVASSVYIALKCCCPG